MEVRLKSINLLNYKGQGTWNFHSNFGNVTKISGRNRAGKSSVLDAYMETLTGKLADGTEPNSVRPHDENGNDINRDDVIRELVFDIDGTETSVKKITSQKWVKKRGSTEEVFEGNKTSYCIDGFESSNQKAFSEWQEKIAKPDVLLMCSNARPFLNTVQKSTAEARKILEELAGFSTEKFITENPKYSNIAEITKNHKIEDTLKQLRRDLNVQKKVASDTKVKLDYEKAREVSIDGGIEIAELELLINGLKEQIAELDRQESILDEAVKAYDEASSGVLELKFELNGLQQKANADLEKKRREIMSRNEETLSKIDKVLLKIRLTKDKISDAEKLIKKNELLRKEQLELWNAANEREFDENSYICPYCKQEYPAEKKEQIRAEFESNKAEELKEITERGMIAKEAIETYKADIEQLKATLKESEDEEINLKESLAGLNTCLEELPDSIDISDTEEYKALQRQIAEKETALYELDNHSSKRAEIKEERQQLLDEISEKKAIILKYQADEEQKEKNVESLASELRNHVQKQADIEKNIDELLAFSIEKNQSLANEINPFFQHFHFCFYDTTQDGGVYETLKLVNNEDGTSYHNGLNKGDRALIELHLCVGLQKMNNLQLPIWCDDVNDIDDDRIPKIEQQLILLERTITKGLKVEILE